MPHFQLPAGDLANAVGFSSDSWEVWLALAPGTELLAEGRTGGLNYTVAALPQRVTAAGLVAPPRQFDRFLAVAPPAFGTAIGSVPPQANATFAFCLSYGGAGPVAPVPIRGRFVAASSPVYRGCADGVAALTFDDGPCTWTDQLLDTLKSKGVRATFFVVGKWRCSITDRLPLLRRIVAEGHQLGVHTWNHISIPYHSEASIRKEMGDLEALLLAETGVRPRYFRPPWGDWNPQSALVVGAMGYLMHMWDLVTDDKVQENATGRYPIQDVLNSVDSDINALNYGLPNGRRVGITLLAHDSIYSTAVELAGPLVDLLKAKGYALDTVANCLGDAEPYRDDDPFAGVLPPAVRSYPAKRSTLARRGMDAARGYAAAVARRVPESAGSVAIALVVGAAGGFLLARRTGVARGGDAGYRRV
ncbi:hypothetical protein DFJ74DRAFT_607802 [Hyaloraphidium curvatum]|nr:hypothetical protein DFJ74DRAFT_607802 [Hyaloraphidium curvatum]